MQPLFKASFSERAVSAHNYRRWPPATAAAAASRAGVGSCHRRHRRQRGIEGGEPLLPPLSKQGILESTRDDEKASLLTTYSVAPLRIQIDGFPNSQF